MKLRLLLLLVFTGIALGQTVGPGSATGTITANSQCVSINVDPRASSTVSINVSGTWSATLQPEASIAGQTANNVQVTPSTSSTAQATITTNGLYWGAAAGVDLFKVCSTSYASGTATVVLTVTTGVASNILGSGGGGGSPGGSNGQVQFNNSGSFGGASGLTFASNALTGWNTTYPYGYASNGVAGKITTSEGQSVSGDFNYGEQAGTQGGACPASAATTVSVTNGSKTVTYVSGTNFATGTIGSSYNWIGQWIQIGGVSYQVSSVAGATSTLQLATNYAGTTSGSAALTYGSTVGDTSDHVHFLAWNGSGPGQAENSNLQFYFGDQWEYNWCAGAGDASMERHMEAVLPDGVGGTYLYRPFFVDVFKTANTAGSTHVGFTHMNLNADNFTLGSITSLGSHTATNYISASPTLVTISPSTNFNNSIAENNAGNANAGITMGTESGQFGGSTNSIVFHAGGASGISAVTTTCSTSGIFQFPAAGADGFYCDGAHYQFLGYAGLNAVGLHATASGPLTNPYIFIPNGSNSGLNVALTYSSPTNWSGWFVSSNGTSGATGYNYLSNRGGGSTLTDGHVGTDTGVTLHVADGNTDMITGDGSGDPNLLNTVKFHGTSGVTAGSFSAITAIATTAGGVTTLTGSSDARLKTDIHSFDKGLLAILGLHPSVYGWNDIGQKITGFGAAERHAGFIAQDVQKSIPEAVGEETHCDLDPHSHGKKGLKLKGCEATTDYLTIADRPILAATVTAVQSLFKIYVFVSLILMAALICGFVVLLNRIKQLEGK